MSNAKNSETVLTDYQIHNLWLRRKDLHGGDLMAQWGDFARAVLEAAQPATAVNCEWTNCPRRVGDVCCNDRPAAPAVLQPLTDERVFADDNIMAINAELGLGMYHCMRIVRAIERAHGITGGGNG